jgi:hypothetical protein
MRIFCSPGIVYCAVNIFEFIFTGLDNLDIPLWNGVEILDHILSPFLLNWSTFSYTFFKFSQQRGSFRNGHYGSASDGVPDHGHIPCSSGGSDITIGFLVEAAGRT